MKLWGVAAVIVVGQLNIGEALATRYTIDKAVFEVTAAPESSEIMVGEPCRVAFKVTNLSERPMVAVIVTASPGPVRPYTYRMNVVNAAGQVVPTIPYMGIPGGCPAAGETIAPHGDVSFHLFLPHWVKLEQPGEYRLTISYRMPVVIDLQPHYVDVSCTTSVKVVAPDPAKFGKLIAEWGPLMPGSDAVEYNESQWAIQMMSAIHDERVIPHFARLAKSNNDMQRIFAGWAMARYRNDRALEVLKGLATAQSSDFLGMYAPGTPVESAEHNASEVRRMAAHQLGISQHPQALTTLWSLADHPRDDVRRTVLRQAARTTGPDARAVIKKLMKDPDEVTRNEAWEHFKRLSQGKEFGAPPPPPSPPAQGAPPAPPPPPP